MIREVSLIKYLPYYVQRYKEIEKVMSAENPEVQSLCNATEIIKNNQFIMTCDEVGIARFEKLLGIAPSKTDTLEMRISRVLIRWNDDIPYTYKYLQMQMNTLCGEKGYLINLYNEIYTLDICIKLIAKDSFNDILTLLKTIVPCNLIVNAYIDYNKHNLFKAFMHKEMAKFTHRELREKIIELDEYLYKYGEYECRSHREIVQMKYGKLRRRRNWYNE